MGEIENVLFQIYFYNATIKTLLNKELLFSAIFNNMIPLQRILDLLEWLYDLGVSRVIISSKSYRTASY